MNDGESPTVPGARSPEHTTPEGGDDGELSQGTTLGRYVILKSLGRGGMGIVYLAFDNELERRVALKVLRPAAMGEGEVSLGETRARLLREAQALAKVSHPNVVSVYDVASFGDEVFVAMEYVHGSTLREWRGAATRSVREVVAAYMQAGRGLEAAHAEGILHRDFKPDNLLVDERGRVKVVDFGLARLEGVAPLEAEAVSTQRGAPRRNADSSASLSAPLTQLGTLLGTPPYMAPEQLVGEKVDARTDQFSFCVTLHEALYGDRPFDPVSWTVPDLVDAIHGARMKPVPAQPRVPRGVRLALRRGLSGDPEARFPSMGALLAEIERALGAPRRIVRGAIAATVVAGAVALLFLRASPGQVCRGADEAIAPSWSPTRADAVARAFTATGNPRASDALTRTRALLDRYAASWVAMSTSACEATRVRGLQSVEGLDLRVGCLRQRAKELEATVDLLVQADAKLVDGAVEAAARLTPVDTCVDVAALRAPFAPPTSAAQRESVEALRRRLAEVDALALAGRTTDAYPIAAALVGEAERTGYAPARAEALWRKGEIESALAKNEASDTLFDAAAEAEAVKHDELAAKAWTKLAFEAGYVQDRYDDAAHDARLADAAIRRIGSSDTLRADLLDTQSNVAYGRGLHADAQRFAREALAIREKSLGPSHPATLQTRSNLADSLWDAGDAEEAVPIYEALHEARVALLGEAHPATLRTLLDIAEARRELGDYPAALAAIDRIRALQSPDTPPLHVAAMRLQLAYTQVGLGRAAEGLATFEDAIVLTGKLRGAESSFVGSHYSTFARVLVQRGEDAAADAYAKRALDLIAKLDTRDEDVGESHGVRALCKVRRGDFAAAVPEAEEALASTTKQFGERGDLVPLLAHGAALVGVGRAKEGLADLERAFALGEAKRGDLAIRADVRFALARALVAAKGDASRAATLAAQAATDLERAGLADAAKKVRAWLAR